MPVDDLVDQLASLSLYAGPARQEGTSEKLEYHNKGEVRFSFYDQLPLFERPTDQASRAAQTAVHCRAPLSSSHHCFNDHTRDFCQ